MVFSALAQDPSWVQDYRGNVQNNGLKATSYFQLPIRDTNFRPVTIGFEVIRPADGFVYVYSGHWTKVGSGGSTYTADNGVQLVEGAFILGGALNQATQIGVGSNSLELGGDAFGTGPTGFMYVDNTPLFQAGVVKNADGSDNVYLDLQVVNNDSAVMTVNFDSTYAILSAHGLEMQDGNSSGDEFGDEWRVHWLGDWGDFMFWPLRNRNNDSLSFLTTDASGNFYLHHISTNTINAIAYSDTGRCINCVVTAPTLQNVSDSNIQRTGLGDFTTVPYPSMFPLRPFRILEKNGQFFPAFTPKDLIQARMSYLQPYYVNYTTGKDSVTYGLNYSTPYKTINYAISSGASLVYVEAGTYLAGAFGHITQSTKKDVYIIGEGQNRTFITNGAPSVSWTDSIGSLYTTTSVSSAADIVDMMQRDSSGFPLKMQQVSSASICASTPYSSYLNGVGEAMINFPARSPDANIIVLTSSYNAYYQADSGTVYIEGLSFIGGGGFNGAYNNFQTLPVTTSPSSTLYPQLTVLGERCSFLYGLDGVSLSYPHFSWFDQCISADNYDDGFAYSIPSQNNANYLPDSCMFVETGCQGFYNGTSYPNNSPESNGSTAHYGLTGLRVGGKYFSNYGPNVADVGGVQNSPLDFCVGVETDDSRAVGIGGGVRAGFECTAYITSPPDTARMYLYKCFSRGDSISTQIGTNLSAVLYANDCYLDGIQQFTTVGKWATSGKNLFTFPAFSNITGGKISPPIALGAANQVLGVNSSGNSQQYKVVFTQNGGTAIGNTYSGDTIYINIPSAGSAITGVVNTTNQTFAGQKYMPNGWIVNATSYPNTDSAVALGSSTFRFNGAGFALAPYTPGDAFSPVVEDYTTKKLQTVPLSILISGQLANYIQNGYMSDTAYRHLDSLTKGYYKDTLDLGHVGTPGIAIIRPGMNPDSIYVYYLENGGMVQYSYNPSDSGIIANVQAASSTLAGIVSQSSQVMGSGRKIFQQDIAIVYPSGTITTVIGTGDNAGTLGNVYLGPAQNAAITGVGNTIVGTGGEASSALTGSSNTLIGNGVQDLTSQSGDTYLGDGAGAQYYGSDNTIVGNSHTGSGLPVDYGNNEFVAYDGSGHLKFKADSIGEIQTQIQPGTVSASIVPMAQDTLTGKWYRNWSEPSASAYNGGFEYGVGTGIPASGGDSIYTNINYIGRHVQVYYNRAKLASPSLPLYDSVSWVRAGSPFSVPYFRYNISLGEFIFCNLGNASWANDSVTVVIFGGGQGYPVTLDGGVTPTIVATPTSLSSFSTTTGTPSTAQTISVSGINLTASITITPPTAYQISTDDATWYSIIALPESGGTVSSTTVYVRLDTTVAATYNGNIACTSSGATTQNVSVTGAVTASAGLDSMNIHFVDSTGDLTQSGYVTMEGDIATAGGNISVTGGNSNTITFTAVKANWYPNLASSTTTSTAGYNTCSYSAFSIDATNALVGGAPNAMSGVWYNNIAGTPGDGTSGTIAYQGHFAGLLPGHHYSLEASGAVTVTCFNAIQNSQATNYFAGLTSSPVAGVPSSGSNPIPMCDQGVGTPTNSTVKAVWSTGTGNELEPDGSGNLYIWLIASDANSIGGISYLKIHQDD